MANKIRVFGAALALLSLALVAFPGSAQNFLTEIPAQNANMVSGPDIGEPIPEFEGYDQNGNLVDLDGVMGPNGAVIVFHRSADW